MNKILMLAAGCMVLSAGLLGAQESDSDLAKVPPPRPPLIARAPARSAWTIQFTPGGGGQGTAASPSAPSSGSKLPAIYIKQQDWTKTGTLMRCVNEWSDGSKTEDWVIGAVKFSQDRQQKGLHLYSPKLDPRYHDFGASDFEMLDWITSKDYVRVVRHNGEVCYLFTSTTRASGSGESGPHNKTLAQINAPATTTSVFVDVQSSLPVEIDNGSGQYVIHFGDPPSDDLKVPESFVALWRASKGR